MIRQAFQQLQNSRSKRARFFFIKGKTKITSCSAQDFDKIYTDFPDRFIGSFNKDISYEDFEVEVQAAINEIFKNDAHIEAIEEKHGQGCGVWVNHSCGFPLRDNADDSFLTKKEASKIHMMFPEKIQHHFKPRRYPAPELLSKNHWDQFAEYTSNKFQNEISSTGLLNG